jgi:hypothetical protein
VVFQKGDKVLVSTNGTTKEPGTVLEVRDDGKAVVELEGGRRVVRAVSLLEVASS